MKCDYCGGEFKKYDLKPVLMYRRTKYMCYKCRHKGEEETKRMAVESMRKKGILGDK